MLNKKEREEIEKIINNTLPEYETENKKIDHLSQDQNFTKEKDIEFKQLLYQNGFNAGFIEALKLIITYYS